MRVKCSAMCKLLTARRNQKTQRRFLDPCQRTPVHGLRLARLLRMSDSHCDDVREFERNLHRQALLRLAVNESDELVNLRQDCGARLRELGAGVDLLASLPEAARGAFRNLQLLIYGSLSLCTDVDRLREGTSGKVSGDEAALRTYLQTLRTAVDKHAEEAGNGCFSWAEICATGLFCLVHGAVAVGGAPVLRALLLEASPEVLASAVCLSGGLNRLTSFPPLHLAVMLGREQEIINLLLDFQADPLEECALLATAIDFAFMLGWANMLEECGKCVLATHDLSAPVSSFGRLNSRITSDLRWLTLSEFREHTAGTQFVFQSTADLAYVRWLLCDSADFSLPGAMFRVPNFDLALEFQRSIRRRLVAQFVHSSDDLDQNQEQNFTPELLAASEDVFIANCGPSVGLGCFAVRDLPANTAVTSYAGHIRSIPATIEERTARHYAYGMEIFVLDGDEVALGGGCSLFHTDGERIRNLGPLLNHESLNPNISCTWCVFGAAVYAVLFTCRFVRAGEQLCYNYGAEWCALRGISELHLLSDDLTGS